MCLPVWQLSESRLAAEPARAGGQRRKLAARWLRPVPELQQWRFDYANMQHRVHSLCTVSGACTPNPLEMPNVSRSELEHPDKALQGVSYGRISTGIAEPRNQGKVSNPK